MDAMQIARESKRIHRAIVADWINADMRIQSIHHQRRNRYRFGELGKCPKKSGNHGFAHSSVRANDKKENERLPYRANRENRNHQR